MPKWHFLFKHVAYKQSEWGKIQAAPSRSQENIERRVDSELPLPSVPMLNGSCSSIDAFLQDEKQSAEWIDQIWGSSNTLALMQECGLVTDLGPMDVTLIPTTVSSYSKQSGTSLYAESKHRDSSDSGSESDTESEKLTPASRVLPSATPRSTRASSSAGTSTSARSKRSATARCTESEGSDFSDSGSESEGGGVAAASATETDRSISRIRLTYSEMRRDILTCSLEEVVEDLRKNHCSVEDINTIMQKRSTLVAVPMPNFKEKIPKFFSQKGITSEVLANMGITDRRGYCVLLNLSTSEIDEVSEFARKAKESIRAKRMKNNKAARTSEPEVQRVTTMSLELASADAAPPAEPHGASPGSARASSSAGTATSARSKRSATARCTESEGSDFSDSGSESEGGGVAAASATETGRSISRISVTYSKMRKDILTCSLEEVIEDLRKNHCSVEDINYTDPT